MYVSYLYQCLAQVCGLEKVRVVNVACGARNAHTLAVTEDGSMWAWGDGSYGKLGTGNTTSSLVPVKVMEFGAGISQIECGVHFSTALAKDGKVYTWSVCVCVCVCV